MRWGGLWKWLAVFVALVAGVVWSAGPARVAQGVAVELTPQVYLPYLARVGTATPEGQLPYDLVTSEVDCRPNEGTTYFQGWVRDRSGARRNAVCVHLDYYGPRETKCSGCSGAGDGNWGFAPFGPGFPGPGEVDIYVVSCETPGLTPLSPKWQHSLDHGEQCAGIIFEGD